MFAYGIFKVLISPSKAFKEIIEKPSFIGPILIMVLFIVANAGSEYARATKIYVQTTFPSTFDRSNPDPWTENCSLWASDAVITCDNNDSVVGYKSVQFDVSNGTTMYMQLQNLGTIDCESNGAYKNLTFSLKLNNAVANPPQNISLYLFSAGTAEYFYRDVTASFNQSAIYNWNNFTAPLGPDAEQWSNSSTQATWSNITGLKIKLAWQESDRSNLTVLVDRVFFQSESYEQILGVIYSDIALSAVYSAIYFAFYWILCGLALTLAMRLFKIQLDIRAAFIILGYSLIALFILKVVLAIFYLVIPPLYLSLDSVFPLSVLQTIVDFNFYAIFLLPILAVILATIGIKTVSNTSLGKRAVIAVIGFLPYYLLLVL